MNRFVKERLVRPAWGFDADHAFLQSARGPLLALIGEIGGAVGENGYLVGDRLTLADPFLLPHLLFFGRTPEGAALLADAPQVAGWLTRMMERPSYVGSDMRRAYEAFRQLSAATPLLWTAG